MRSCFSPSKMRSLEGDQSWNFDIAKKSWNFCLIVLQFDPLSNIFFCYKKCKMHLVGFISRFHHFAIACVNLKSFNRNACSAVALVWKEMMDCNLIACFIVV